MSSLRRFALLGLLPLGIVGTMGTVGARKTASAAPRTTPAATRAPNVVLPHGVRQRLDGRYMRRICDRCQGFFLLPETWQPGMEVPSRPVPEATTHSMGPTDVLTAYNIPSTSSSGGKIVAILDYPDNHAFTD